MLINEIQWIQYQLDNYSSIKEVLENIEKIYIKPYAGGGHYFLYDSTGHAATVEILEGEVVTHFLSPSDVQVLTNHTYTDSMEYLKTHVGFGGKKRPPDNATGSRDRFVCAANKIKSFRDNNSTGVVPYAFNILKAVSQKSTARSVVYDIANRAVHVKIPGDNYIRSAYFSEFDFSCEKPVMTLDIHIDKTGNVSSFFEPYCRKKHERLVWNSIKRWRANNFATHITDADVQRIIDLPDTMICK
jgi:choloylglycine hydrolase